MPAYATALNSWGLPPHRQGHVRQHGCCTRTWKSGASTYRGVWFWQRTTWHTL